MSTHRILIADDDPDVVKILSLRCATYGFEATTTDNAQDALCLISSGEFDVACFDVDMPGGGGLTLVETMAADLRLAEIPVIVLTGKSDAGTIRRCHDHCAYYVLKSPQIWDRVEPLLRTLTMSRGLPPEPNPILSSPWKTEEFTMHPDHRTDRLNAILEALEEKVRQQAAEDESAPADAKTPLEPESTGELPWILCIEDDQDFSRAMKMRLEARGIVVVRAFHGIDGYRLAFTHPAKAILLDYNLPGGQGDYVLRRLKENPLTADIPVIVITGRKDHSVARTMYNLGAAAYLTKPVIFDELLAELSKHVELLSSDYLTLDSARESALIID